MKRNVSLCCNKKTMQLCDVEPDYFSVMQFFVTPETDKLNTKDL